MTRLVQSAAACGCCYSKEPVHGGAVFIEGHPNDGSPGCHRFVDHPDCIQDMAHDLNEMDQGDGGVSHGRAIEAIDMNHSH